MKNEEKQNGKKRKYNKSIVAFMFIFAALAIVIGVSVSYFSDIIRGTGTATAGTLDVSGTIQVYQNGTLLADGTVNNLNPGDMLVVKGTITNAGNKSTWLRSVIVATLPVTNPMPDVSMIKVYVGEFDSVEDLAGETPATMTDGTFESSTVIMNGVGTDAETEPGGIATYSPSYTIYFDAAAGNQYQGKNIDFGIIIQAIQYRNNPNPTWDDVVTTEFGT